MKNKLKNTFTDIVVFFGYHALVLAGTLGFFAYLTIGEFTFDFNKISEAQPAQKPEVSEVIQAPSIDMIKGEVKITELGSETRPAREGDKLSEGAVLETGPLSTVRLKFGKEYDCKVRIGANTKLNIDTFMRQQKEAKTDSTLFHLIKGSIHMLLKNDSKKAEVKIKTFAAVFAIRGTKLSVMTDGSESTILAVFEGLVDAENFFTSKLTSVAKDNTYLIQKSGLDKLDSRPEEVQRWQWDADGGDLPDLNIHEVVTQIGPPIEETPKEAAPTQMVVNPVTEDVKKLAELELNSFKKETEEIREIVQTDSENLQQLKLKLDQERPKIVNDINCIQKSTTPCDLFAERILIQRGFPVTKGNPRLMKSIVEDLQKYLEESKVEIEGLEKKIKANERLIPVRESVQKWAEERLQSDAELERIVPKLRARDLERYQ